MKTVTAREANQQFSKLLAEVAAGQEVTIVSRGRPVARLVPVGPAPDQQREEAIQAMLAEMQAGHRLAGRAFTRDEMHER